MSSHRTPAGQHVRRRSTAHRVVATGAAVVVGVGVVGAAAGAAVVTRLDGNITSVDVDAQLGGSDRPGADGSSDEGSTGPLNILVMGSDDRSELREGGDAFGGDIGGGGSDTTLLVHLAGDRQSATAVSIPRDSMVEVPGCGYTDDDEATEAERASDDTHLAMFNSALAGGGPACAIQTVEINTDVRVDHFAVVDFDGFQDMVDALGGVEVCLPEAVDDPKSHLDLPAGTSRVSGEQALAYVRARYNVPGTEGSDIGRIGRQQQFLSSVVQEVTSAGVLLRPDRLVRFLDAATQSLTTDPGLASVPQLTRLAQSVSGMRPDDVSFVTVPFEAYEPDPNRLQWAQPAADALWESIRTDSPLPGSEPEPEPAETAEVTPPLTVSPADITVEVYNGTGESGRAGEAQADLQLQGFTVPVAGNADPGALDGVRVSYPTGSQAAAETVAAAFPGANVVEDPSLSGVVVTLGAGAPDVAEVPNRLGEQALPDRSEPEPEATVEARSGAEDICS